MILKDLLPHKLSTDEPCLRLTEREIIFNVASVELLNLNNLNRIFIRYSEEDKALGRNRAYIASTSSPHGYATRKLDNRRTFGSKSLCKALGEFLDGPGKYRICKDDVYEADGLKWYNIFFKKYD